MRQMETRKWLVMVVATGMFTYLGIVSTQAADPTDVPAGTPSSPTTQAPPSGSPPPQGQMGGEHRQQAMHKMKEACGADIQKLCQNVKPGEGRIIQCLEQHQSEVSPSCNQLLTKKESRQGKGE